MDTQHTVQYKLFILYVRELVVKVRCLSYRIQSCVKKVLWHKSDLKTNNRNKENKTLGIVHVQLGWELKAENMQVGIVFTTMESFI